MVSFIVPQFGVDELLTVFDLQTIDQASLPSRFRAIVMKELGLVKKEVAGRFFPERAELINCRPSLISTISSALIARRPRESD
jgi:hypothetical protein